MNHGQSHFHLIRDILFFPEEAWYMEFHDTIVYPGFSAIFCNCKIHFVYTPFFSWLTVVQPATFIFITSKKDNPIPIQHHQKSVRDPCFLHPSVHYCLDFPYKMQNYTHHECQSVEVHHIRLPDSSTPDYTG